MTMPSQIAVALGDPNGIGPEIAVKAALSLQGLALRPVLVGDTFVIEHYLKQLAPDSSLGDMDSAARDGVLTHVPVQSLEARHFQPGQILPDAGRATVAYVAEAVKLAKSGRVSAVVGCPHSETAINRAGIEFSGYPGLIADLTDTPREKVFLLLVAAGLHIAHVTLHESVQSALGRLSEELIVDAACATLGALQKLGCNAPSLGVFGINPHAGEQGLFGDDDQRITEPAVQRLRALGHQVEGPVGADVLLGQRRHDAYLAMFHDQGHIPIKLLSPLRSSAMTIGTDILFSSVGHGCAHDIAGKGVADPVSVIETLKLLHHSHKDVAQ